MKDRYKIYMYLIGGAILLEGALDIFGLLNLEGSIGAILVFLFIFLGLRVAYALGAEIKKEI